MSNGEEYLRTVERMEPEIHPIDAGGAYASISISLKRIADAFEEHNKRERAKMSGGLYG